MITYNDCATLLIWTQQFLYKFRRFRKFEELDPIELEKVIQEGDNDYNEDKSILSFRDRLFKTFASDMKVYFDMKGLVLDLTFKKKTFWVLKWGST